MIQTEINNFWKIVERSQTPLVCFKENFEGEDLPLGGDAIASALALAYVLEKSGKNPDVVSTGFKPLPHLNFLAANEKIKNSIEALRKFVISLDISKNKIKDFSYDIKDDELNIYLSPKEGLFNAAALKTRHENFKYDLVIALDTPSLNHLGSLYSKHSELFYNLPVVNIDHSPANELYGQINLVDLTASSTSEIIAHLIKGKDIRVDSDLSTKIMAGMIAKTKSFRAPNISPKTLQLASRLMELGARREEIVQNFYRTRSIETLKLWGRALARLKSVPEKKLVWTLLSREDFMHAGAASDAELVDIIHELITSSPQADVIALLYEQEPLKICVVIATIHGRDASELGKIFNAEGNRGMVKFCLNNLNIVEAEKHVITNLEKII